jgi:dTDP-4-amino-4,6-dideoxygalactose transaminase
MSNRVPSHRPALAGRESSYVQQAIASLHLAGDGPFTRKCQTLLEETLGVTKAFLTTSCTHALEMSALLLEVEPGDEVIVPDFTFVSTVNAFVLRGAQPRFCDIRPDTLNLDESRLEELLSPRTKAIVAMHYAGVACEMDSILALGARHGVAVVEDNAHGLFGKYRGKHLGTLGCLATQSFHDTKHFTCGEGGALLINDARFTPRAEILREKGTDRSRFFRGEVDKYSWTDLGSSYLPSEILAAFLLAQLEEREAILERGRRVWERYRDGLSDWAAAHGIRLPVVPAHCQPPFHLFYLLLPTSVCRDALIVHLRSHAVSAVFHYLPLHLSRMGRMLGGREGDCPVSEDLSGRLLRLPFSNRLPSADQERVIDLVTAFRCPETAR